MKILKVNGPYVFGSGPSKGRKFVEVTYEDGREETTLYSRFLMEQVLGRELSRDEHVDHIDEDPTNDLIENLQILSLSDNAKKSAKARGVQITWYQFECPICGVPSKKNARHVKNNWKKGRAGPFCSKRCAGIFSTTQA